MPTDLIASDLLSNPPEIGSPQASYYSILTAPGFISGIPVINRPKLSTYHLWDLPINWETGVTEQISYRTEVIMSRDGSEQRIAQRVNPRYSFRFETLVSHTKAAKLERLVSSRMSSNFRFRHPRAAVLQQRSDPGSFGFIGRFERDPKIKALTDRVLSTELSVQVNPGVYAGDYMTTHLYPPAETFHNGLEVFTLSPNWASPVNLTFSQMAEILDLQRGVTDYSTPQRFTKRLIDCGFMLKNQSEEDRLRGIFQRMRGQQGEFYMVDPLSTQIVLTSGIAENASSITIPGHEVFLRFKDELTYRNLAIRTRSGTFYRRIAEIVRSGQDTRLNLTSILPAIAVSDIIGVHWLLKVRFSTDTIVLGWATDTVARTTLNLRTMEDVL